MEISGSYQIFRKFGKPKTKFITIKYEKNNDYEDFGTEKYNIVLQLDPIRG